MRRGALAAIGFIVLCGVAGCASQEGADAAVGAATNVPFQLSDDFGDEITIHGVTATRMDDEVLFLINYRTDEDKNMVLFDPPGGDIISVRQSLPAGDGVVEVYVDTVDLRSVDHITVGFNPLHGDETRWAFLDYPTIAELIGLPVAGSKELDAMPEARVVVGRSQGEGVALWVGMDRATVFEVLGTPDMIFYGDERFDPTDRQVDGYHLYRDLDVSVLIQQEEVTGISIVGPLAVSTDGLHGDMLLSDALEILGSSFTTHLGSGKTFFRFTDRNIELEVSDQTELVMELTIYGD